MFGTGYLLDGSHPEIKVEPYHFSPGATERTRGSFTFVKRRGFKRRPRISHRTSRVTMFDTQECVELEEPKVKGRPSGGVHFSDVSASSELEVIGGVWGASGVTIMGLFTATNNDLQPGEQGLEGLAS